MILKQAEQWPWRVAMPAPLPEGLTFKNHNTHVYAHIGDDPNPIGHLYWWGEKTQPEDPTEVAGIRVHPDYRHHGIATAMYDWAKQNVEPKLHHSVTQTEQGRQWADYEEQRQLVGVQQMYHAPNRERSDASRAWAQAVP